MKKITFRDILPHALAIGFFLVVTIAFFNPIFFGNKVINQNDISQFLSGSKELRDFRAATGEEGRWASTMFSGLPAYLVNMDWSDGVVVGMKKVLSLFLPHPISNVFLAFVSVYILLLTFRVRSYLAIAPAIAYGLCSYIIIGLSAGHNARIGAIAFMPLVLAGIHLTFSGKKVLGFALTAAALSLQLRENHVQITYYLIIMVVGYGLFRLVEAIQQKTIPDFFKTIGVLVVAAALAAGTFFGPLWAITEFSKYSTRGPSELVTSNPDATGDGLPKSYAFTYSNGITEPITMLIPEFYGGSSFNSFVSDQNSATYKALVGSGNEQLANQLAGMARSYWGSQPISAPYYAGAIIIFLAVAGMMLYDRRVVFWLVGVSLLAIAMSWGSNFSSFNYFLFDHLPGYNKFRSVTFVMVIPFLALPLLAGLALEKLFKDEITPAVKMKLLIAFAVTGGLSLLFVLLSGMPDYMKKEEAQLPAWFLNALREDRQGLLRADSFRSFSFIVAVFVLFYFGLHRKMSQTLLIGFIVLMVTFDSARVDARYFTKQNYGRKGVMERSAWPSNLAIQKDKDYYRVSMLLDFYDATTSNFHNSLGGYNGARIKRYQELFDSVLMFENEMMIAHLQKGDADFEPHPVTDMLNARYLLFGEQEQAFIRNPTANGAAWFVREVKAVQSPNEELAALPDLDTRHVAVVDIKKFKQPVSSDDSTASVAVVDRKPYWIKYETQSAADGLAIFSEIYYPQGWTATIDGKPASILRANYVLRGLEIPSGKHVVEFTFEPKPYMIGDKITMASSWILLGVVLASLGFTFREEKKD